MEEFDPIVEEIVSKTILQKLRLEMTKALIPLTLSFSMFFFDPLEKQRFSDDFKGSKMGHWEEKV